MKYRVLLDKRALEQLAAFPRSIQEQIAKRLRTMEDSPFHNAEKLQGRDGYRIRSGDYRILFDVAHSIRTVTVFAIGNRKDILSLIRAPSQIIDSKLGAESMRS